MQNIFAGVDQSRRDKEINRLNKSYSDVIASKGDLKSCLQHLVANESYRMLDGWSYSLNPQCLRSAGRSLEMADQTDVKNMKYFTLIFKLVDNRNLKLQADQSELDRDENAIVREAAVEVQRKGIKRD